MSSICYRRSVTVIVIAQCLITAFAQMVIIRNNEATVKGGTYQLICQGFLENNALTSIFKSGKNDALNQCQRTFCITSVIERYSFSADNSEIFINITALNRQEDEKTWKCTNSELKSAQRFIVVYTLPTVLLYSQTPSTNQNLALTSISLECRTDCCYPQPSIEWYYIQAGGKQKWTTNGTTTAVGQCTDSEKVYISVLMLPKYTTFRGNLDTSVKFQCVSTYQGLTNELVSSPLVDIQFAVRVTNVSLRLGNTDLTTSSRLNVTASKSITLTCSPSTGKPEATLLWYIGNIQQSSSSTTFVFTPKDSDHGKQLYCKAMNFENDSLAVFSEKPTLYVNVEVATVTLQDGNLEPTASIFVSENQTKTLTCTTSTSRPAATLVWYIGTTERFRSSEDNSYTFIPTNSDHDSVIYCAAFNVQPESHAVISASPRLYVKVAASTPTLNNQTSDSLVVLSGETVNLECISSPTRPPVLVVWSVGNVQYSNVTNTNSTVVGGLSIVRSVLTITPNKNDSGNNVICETYILDQNPKPQRQLKLQVYWPPSEPTIKADVAFPWFEGNTSRYLDCSSSNNGNPAAIAKWTTQIGLPALENSRRLDMPTLTSGHNGLDVTCILENEYTRRKEIIISSTIKINVEYYPVIRVQVDGVDVVNVTRNEGQNLSAVCIASGNPNTTVQWIKYQSHQLVLNDLNRTNDGSYHCLATGTSTKYGMISSRKQLQLIVNYAPNAILQLSGSIQEGTDMSIRCNASGKPDTYVFANLTQTWNGMLLKTISMDRSGGAVLTNLTIQDSGNYTCLVDNGIPDKTGKLQQSATEKVLIKGKPKISQKATNMFAGNIGESVNITIPFYSFPAIKEFSIKKQNGTIILGSDKYVVGYASDIILDVFHNVIIELYGYLAIFYISEQEEYDFGNYSLVLINDIGVTEWKFVHTSRSRPQPPKSLTLIWLKDSIATFLLTGGFNGGVTQTFVIEIMSTRSDTLIQLLKIQENDGQYKLPNGSYLFNISGLSPDTYLVRVVAENDFGRTDISQALTVKVIIEGQPTNTLPVAAIGGAIGSVIFVFAVIAGAFLVWKKRFRIKGESRTKLNGKPKQNSDDSSDDDVVENLAYVSADEVKTTKFDGSSDALYSQPIKKSNSGKADIHTVGDKMNGEDFSQMYAQPAKKDRKDKKNHEKKKTGQIKADVYENAEPVVKINPDTTDDNLYENPEPKKVNAKKNVNKDGLIYADLTFDSSSKGQKKLIIHGLDNMTEYGQIDFSKKAECLPDSDDENNDK